MSRRHRFRRLTQLFTVGTVGLAVSLGAASVPATSAAALGPTTRAVEKITTVNTFQPGKVKLRKAQKRKLAADVRTVVAGSADPAASTLRIVGLAKVRCHWTDLRGTDLRGDVVCASSRSLAKQRTLAVQRYVRSIGYPGSITRVVKVVKHGKTDRTRSTFTYTPPAPALGFTVVNDTGVVLDSSAKVELTLGLSYPCNPAITTCTASVGYGNPHQFGGEVLQSDPVVEVSTTIPASAAHYPYIVVASNATCSRTTFNVPAGPLDFTCTITGNGAVIRVIPLEGA